MLGSGTSFDQSFLHNLHDRDQYLRRHLIGKRDAEEITRKGDNNWQGCPCFYQCSLQSNTLLRNPLLLPNGSALLRILQNRRLEYKY